MLNGQTNSQNQKVILGSMWAMKCNDFDCKMLGLSKAGNNFAESESNIMLNIKQGACNEFDYAMVYLSQADRTIPQNRKVIVGLV